MARPTKEGLGYFPMDVDIDQDDKLIVPIAKHGMPGFGVIVKMMMEVYRNGYHYPWTDKEKYVFSFKIGMDREVVCSIIDDCIESGFFDKTQYEMNQILTSHGFQKRFLMAATRRKDSVIIERFRVLNEFMQTETELLQAETPEMSAESTQSKLNKSKVNKTKLNKTIDTIFTHWKSKDLTKHRTLTPQIKQQIEWKLNNYSEDDLLICITNYSIILNDPNYKLTTKWGLDDFLEKGHFEKFHPDRDPFSFYPQIQTQQITQTKQSKLSKNKERLLGGRGNGQGDRAGSQVHSVQGISSLPEST